MPTAITLYRWRIRDEITGRMRVTRHHMTEADALARHPEAERLDDTREVREVPDDPWGLMTNAWQRTPP